ncbi:hypothetical protein AXG93_3309s1020 [Marchantia polymorpha subsp. ruderalis]|uniref:Uncharacterized protein n=1 Tax=Marchantia polymorpha subsp. ruderalis TaxID=1480154 RepID=A0A176W6Z9_MARPO|nr:hypothetical protein AXG93_3309s1020 [Marchantia polymorpha subsp. ruderalis]
MLKYESSCESESTTSVIGFRKSDKVESEIQEEDAPQNLPQCDPAIPGLAGPYDFSLRSGLSNIPTGSGEASKSVPAADDEKQDGEAPRCRLEIVLADPPRVEDEEDIKRARHTNRQNVRIMPGGAKDREKSQGVSSVGSTELGGAEELEVAQVELGHISDSNDEDNAISGVEREQGLQSGELMQIFKLFNQEQNDLKRNGPSSDFHHAGASMELYERKYCNQTRGECEHQINYTSLATSPVPDTGEDKNVSSNNELGDKSSCNLESRIAQVTSSIPQTRSRKRKEATVMKGE